MSSGVSGIRLHSGMTPESLTLQGQERISLKLSEKGVIMKNRFLLLWRFTATALGYLWPSSVLLVTQATPGGKDFHAEEMSTIGSFEGFQPVSLKQEGEDQLSETEHLSMEEEDPGNGQEPRQISRQSSVTKSTLHPNPYRKPYTARTYFVTRPGAIETAMEDLKSHIAETSGETIQGFWLLTEIDHWNNEKERIVLVTDKTLFICKYDFLMLSCVQLQHILLSAVHRICLGKFVFPKMSLDK
ncbi:Tumor protein p63-regulated gene 1 protein [Fukomys damarensis]|uniref:Tumor protein p63-regulated gene 1 protein n=1 Tax=Fukomys damarensis TaxID=885580 RepID=A0A091DRT4_FUKDA|nr:Tumor protein p63-regulated gene 1 protein [Fukomys damarensis]